MARYRVVIKPSATKELESIPQKEARQRIVARVRSLGDDPRPVGCEKLSGHRDRYRIRHGDYRIVYSIDGRESIVRVVRIGHRKDVYR